MKGKLLIGKSRSPRRDSGHNEGEVGNEAEEGNHARPAPYALVVADKPSKFKGVNLSTIKALFGRKARSNSPKSKVSNTSQQVFKAKFPNSSRNSPNKAANTSYGAVKEKQKVHLRKGVESRQDLRSSPSALKILEPEKLELIRTIAQRKHRLNRDLWEAAEAGDIPRLSRLLRPLVFSYL